MKLTTEVLSADLLKVVCSNPFDKNGKYSKISLRPVEGSGKNRIFHIEKLTKTQAFHENVTDEQLPYWLENNVLNVFKQVCLYFPTKNVTYLFSQKGSTRLEKPAKNKEMSATFNRSKNYIFNEGENIPAFVDLGVFTKDFKIVQSKYDKFKQINRFIELIDDAFKNFDK